MSRSRRLTAAIQPIGIGPEISQSVKDIYSAAKVCIIVHGAEILDTRASAGPDPVGGGRCHTHPEERQDRHTRCCYYLYQEEHRCP